MELEDEIRVDHKADGRKESMIKWAGKEGYNLDLKQRLAFQAIISSFVLTFVDEARYVESASDVSTTRAHMRALRRHLIEMTQIRTFDDIQYQPIQLLMFMTGAGGSGKSRVIDAVMQYGREYVENLGLIFTRQTIVVTAMSGVAAVNINGETTQRACHTNANIKNLSNEMI